MVNLSAVLKNTRDKKYAVGSFNVYNYETIRGVAEAAKETNMPAIIAFGEKYLSNMDVRDVSVLVSEISNRVKIPLVLHLDHCKNTENIYSAIKAGFTSVMYDGSALSYEENCENTKKVVDIANAMGVSVEAELGSIASGTDSHEGEENDKEIFTDPVKAGEFVSYTGVDALAVSIGTVHGMYKGEPKIDIDVLKKISEKVSIPLVLHGGSGTPEETVKECIYSGICKINVNTEISMYVLHKIKELLETEGEYHLSAISLKEIEFAKDVVKRYMNLFANDNY